MSETTENASIYTKLQMASKERIRIAIVAAVGLAIVTVSTLGYIAIGVNKGTIDVWGGVNGPNLEMVYSTFDRATCYETCLLGGTFLNTGKEGGGSAVFTLMGTDGAVRIASCSVEIPDTANGETTATGCEADSVALEEYARNYPKAGLVVNAFVKDIS